MASLKSIDDLLGKGVAAVENGWIVDFGLIGHGSDGDLKSTIRSFRVRLGRS